MAVAVAALFLALGAGAYAAVKLPSNSVGAAQLKSGAVTAAKLRANAVTSIKVKNHSLLGVDFKAGQLPVRVARRDGTAGAQGRHRPPGGQRRHRQPRATWPFRADPAAIGRIGVRRFWIGRPGKRCE